MRLPRWTLRAAAVFVACVGSAAQLRAQGVTTGAITGTVTNDQGQPVDAAQVQVVNRATGARTGAMTRGDGRYFVQALEVGGPYTVTVRRIGFSPRDSNNIYVSLGAATRVDFRMSARATQITGVQVTATTTSAVISPTHEGVVHTVTDSAIARLPTFNRNFTDFVVLTPQVATKGPGNSGGGQNNRFNAIQIDGAVASDLFGLGSTNQPGAQAGAKQISLEAVKEYQVLLAPYDVRQGNFTGFLLNAVTKSGSNELHGSGTFAERNERLERDVTFLRASPFTQKQEGFWVGGPIVRDKLFFSVAPEFQQQQAPASGPFVGTGTPTPTPVTAAGVDSLRNILMNQYGFADPGNGGAITNENPLANMFARIDAANLPFGSRLVTRYNYVNAQQDIFSRSSSTFGLSNNGYNFGSKTNSGGLQLFSNFASGNSNEFLTSMTAIRDARKIPLIAPFVRISRMQNPNGGTTAVTAGSENSSQGNQLDQDIFELTDNFTIPWNTHRFTIGTKNQWFRVRNLFSQNSYGNFTFGTLDSLIANRPSSATLGENLDALNGRTTDGAARFRARTYGLYAEDEWNPMSTLTLTYGIRLDMPGLVTTPGYNGLIDTVLNVNTTQVPKNVKQWAPRFGFNWDVTGDQMNQLRGGSGVFVGQPAYVWLSNVFGNSGVNGFANLSCTSMATAPQMPNAGQPIATNCVGSTAKPNVTVNTVDPNLKFPSVWRSSLGYDRRLPWNVIATVEGMYTRSVAQFYYQNIGLQANPVGFDRNGRALYGDITSGNNTSPLYRADTVSAGPPVVTKSVRDVIQLGNTKHAHDYSYSVTGQLQKRFTDNFEGSLAYTYGHSYDVWDVTSSVAYSNWQFGRSYSGRQDSEALNLSKFDVPHRVVGTATYTFPSKTDISVDFFGESGVPFEYVYGSDMNADNSSNNDLVYVPKNAHDTTEIRFSQNGSLTPSAQADSLNAYIASHACLNSQRGTIMTRNSCRTPWTKVMNVSARQSLKTIGMQNFILQLDIFNFLNMLNKNWGAQDLGSSNSPALLTRRSFVNANGTTQTAATKMAATDASGNAVTSGGAMGVFNFTPANLATQFNTRNASSNYAMQLQLKYTF